jgi:outer membrane protein OmpA-like peptidoglycan-associated protein
METGATTAAADIFDPVATTQVTPYQPRANSPRVSGNDIRRDIGLFRQSVGPALILAAAWVASLSACSSAPVRPIESANIEMQMAVPVYFLDGKVTLDPESVQELGRIASWLEINPNSRIMIESREVGLRLSGGDPVSLARVAAVRKFLTAGGIDSTRIALWAYGEPWPDCDNPDACRNENRKTDFRIVAVGWSRGEYMSAARMTLGPKVDTFPWPPPLATKWTRLPVRLCVNAREKTLGGSVDLIRAAFRRGGFPETERTYLIGKTGFAMAGHMEAIADDATFKPPPDRWAAPEAETPWQSFSITGYLRALFSANTGHYRIIVIALTDHMFAGPQVVPVDSAIRAIPENGLAGDLPTNIAKTPLAQSGLNCYAFVYEFERPVDPKRTRLVDSSREEAIGHLVLARLWTRDELKFP